MKTKFKGYTITANHLPGKKEANWNDKQSRSHCYHEITVSKKGRQIEFDFWSSLVHPKITTKQDCIAAFECFLNDAIAGENTFEEFCGEFGYDTDSRKAEETWKACQIATGKAKYLLDDDDLYDLINAINEIDA